MPTRRRFISIVATCSAFAPLAALSAGTPGRVSTWRGMALGALASMTLVHPDRPRAQAALRACTAEIERLESIFSLYRPDSALSRLNAGGELAAPPVELVELLSFALALAQRSGGFFDPTIQPLYRLYADHFAAPGAVASGPSAGSIARVLQRVDHRGVELDAARIGLRKAGMAITLNGVAQGFLTDRVADLLRDGGFDDVLVDLGEARALGHRPGGGAWTAGLADPRRPGHTLLELPLASGHDGLPALATSAGYGTRFGPDPRMHHLLDPHTGRSANHYLSVSVAAPRATLADGLSTAISVAPPARAAALLASEPLARAYVVGRDGRLRMHGGLPRDRALAANAGRA